MSEIKSACRVADALRVAAMNVKHRGWLPTTALRRATGCEHGEGSHAGYTMVWYVYQEANGETLAESEKMRSVEEIVEKMEYAAEWPQALRVLP